MARIWAEVLRVSRVGIDDDFFDLGGDSVKISQVVARIREAFDVEIPLPRLYSGARTVADLCAAICEQQASQVDARDLESLLDEVEQSAGGDPQQDGTGRRTGD